MDRSRGRPCSGRAGRARIAGGPALDLEQRIGARWATWVGIVAILFAVSFFLKWSFDSDLLTPARAWRSARSVGWSCCSRVSACTGGATCRI
jgi:uncharacterized membrane protein